MTTNQHDIDKNITSLSDAIRKAGVSFDDKGVATLDKSVYTDNMPEGLDAEVVKKVNHYNTEFVAGAALAVGQEAVPFLKKHKDVNRVEVSIPMVGRDKLEIVMDRSKENRSPQSGEVSTKYGVMRAELNFFSDRGKSGELKKVRDFVNELAEKALA